ncbi:MAG: DNA recombination protein RmuC, partial [Pseudomonadota bacterium]
MDSAILLIVVMVVGAALGGAASWFFASRPVADLQERLDTRESEFKQAIAELGEAKVELSAVGERAARADGLATDLDKAREENAAFRAERAGFAEQKRLLEESRDKLLKEFENTGAQVLG